MRLRSITPVGLVIALTIAGVARGSEPVPEFYGFYALSGGVLKELGNINRNERMKYFQYTNLGMQGRVGLSQLGDVSLPADVRFLAYGPDWRDLVSKIVLYRLHFATSLRANVLSIGIEARVLTPNLWLAEPDQALRVGPVQGQQDLYKLVPAAPLQPGAYAIAIGPLSAELSQIDLGAIRFVTDFYVGEKPAQPAPEQASVSAQAAVPTPAPGAPEVKILSPEWTAECAGTTEEPRATDKEMKAIYKADERAAAKDLGFKAFMKYVKNRDNGAKSFKAKDYANAATYFQQALEIRPDDWYAHFMLGSSYAYSKNPDGALAESCFALKRLRYKWVYYAVAKAFMAKGDKQASLHWLGLALTGGLGESKKELDDDFPDLASDADYNSLLASHGITGR